MDLSWQFKLLLLLIFFVSSAFFSSSETALFSIDSRKIKNILSQNPFLGRYLSYLLSDQKRLLVTILIGNTIVNTAASIIGVSLALEFGTFYSLSPDIVLPIQIIILTILIIFFCELIPKIWATKNPVSVAKISSVPLYLISIIFYPVSEIITETIKVFTAKIKLNKSKAAIKVEELTELANISHEKGTIIEEEHGLIHSLVNFRSVNVHEVMTPRVDMVAISDDSTFEDLLELITKSGHSRIPLYKDDLDQILGVIYAKDILPYIKEKEKRKQFSYIKLARKPLFIPPTKMINNLMHEFQEKKMHIAIVVDEYGGTAGLITLEDIIEEIIGEIRDEYDKEENPVVKINDNTYEVLGKLTIDELNELLSLNIVPENEDYETVGGLVLNQAGDIPKEGYTFRLDGFKFTVKEVLKKRVMKVLIEKASA